MYIHIAEKKTISISDYYFFYHVAHFKNNNTYFHQMKIIRHFLISNDIHCNFG